MSMLKQIAKSDFCPRILNLTKGKDHNISMNVVRILRI
jgi:hypothetical protein